MSTLTDLEGTYAKKLRELQAAQTALLKKQREGSENTALNHFGKNRDAISISHLNELLSVGNGPVQQAVDAFANVSEVDRNKIWFDNKLSNKKKHKDTIEQRKRRFYNLRAFNHDSEQNEIAQKLRDLESTPHMTVQERLKFLHKKQTRFIYDEQDVPDSLRGEDRKKWLHHKNKKQKIYLQGDSQYDLFVKKQRDLSKLHTTSSKYKYNYTYKN